MGWGSLSHQTIHESPKYSSTDKYKILLRCLKGPARRLAGNRIWTEDLYERTIANLIQEYESLDLDHHLLRKKLFSVSPLVNDGPDLRRFLMEWNNSEEEYVQVTKASLSEDLLEHAILSKLNPTLLETVYRHYNSTSVSLKELKDGLYEHARTKELAKLLTEPNKDRLPVKPSNSEVNSNSTMKLAKPFPRPTSGALKPKTPSIPTHNPAKPTQKHAPEPARAPPLADNSVRFKCLFCDHDGHSSTKCPWFLDSNSQLMLLNQLGRCTKCLSTQHVARDCTAHASSKNCKRGHKLPLCHNILTVGHQPDGLKADPPSVQLNHIASSESEQTNQVNEINPAVLPAFNGDLVNGKLEHFTRVFLDCSTQRTFVFRLNLFNMDKPPQCPDLVQFNLKIGRCKQKVVAIINPNMGKNIRTPGYTHAVRTLEASGLRLTDRQPDDNATGIEIILGANYLPRLLKRTCNIKGVNLLSTLSGYVVWGELPDWSRKGKEPLEVDSLSLTLNRISVTDPVGVEPLVENLWKLDAVGISNKPFSHLEAQPVDLFKRTTRYANGRYTVQLPFKSDSRLEINFGKAFAQLMSVKYLRTLSYSSNTRPFLMST
ncbi:uncharacterized protein [Palaemon carinicauda]|uniref:uncharacterized protein n=1 Tax=Palaemon carinicauda TaxID=392227 RepID=UPI0035B67AE5